MVGDKSTNTDELLEVFEFEDACVILMESKAGHIAGSEADDAVDTINRVDDESIQRDDIGMRWNPHHAVCLVPPQDSVGVADVVLEHGLPRLAWVWRVGDEVDLQSKAVDLGEMLAAHSGDTPGEFGTERVERHPGVGFARVGRAGHQRASIIERNSSNIPRNGVDELVERFKEPLGIIWPPEGDVNVEGAPLIPVPDHPPMLALHGTRCEVAAGEAGGGIAA